MTRLSENFPDGHKSVYVKCGCGNWNIRTLHPDGRRGRIDREFSSLAAARGHSWFCFRSRQRTKRGGNL